MSKSKLFVGFVALAVGLSLAATPASAQTIAELQAQVQALMAQLAALQGGTTGSTAGACSFTRDLLEGSSGDDVRCLQDYLKSTGHFPAATTSTGTFGPITRDAVAAWQTASGITPAAGYFGPISRTRYASMAGTGVVPPLTASLPAGCMTGDAFSRTTGQACVVSQLPAGCMAGDAFSRTTGQVCTATTPPTGVPITPGVPDGKLVVATVSLESSPSDGTDVKIGDANKEIARWKVKATNDGGILRQFTIETTNRSWLYWRAARLKSGGSVVAERANLSSSDFNEVTVGSLYQLPFTGLSIALPVGTDVYFILEVDAVTDTSRAAANGLVVRHPSSGLIVVDEDDAYTVSTGVTTNRTWDFVAATTGNAVPSINVTSPGARFVKVSEQGTSPNITMLVFDVKAENRDIELNTIRVGASTSEDALSSMIISVDLYEGSCVTDGITAGCTLLGGSTAAAGGTDNGAGRQYTFSDLNVPIASGVKKAFTVKALWADEDDYTVESATSSAASTTVSATVGSLSGVDKPNFNTITVSGSAVTGGDLHTVLIAPTVSDTSASARALGGEAATDHLSELNYSFTIKPDGGAIYMSKTASIMLDMFTTATGTATTSLISNITADECGGCLDGGTYYLIPSDVPRRFRFTGAMSNLNGMPEVKRADIRGIYFGDAETTLTKFRIPSTIPGMQNLKASVLLQT